MATFLYSHPDCLDHVTPPGHPERVDRLTAIQAALAAPEFSDLIRMDAPLAEDSDLRLTHPDTYISHIKSSVPVQGWNSLDPDTHVSPGSVQAALRGAGGNIAAVDAVLDGDAANAFVGCRPPGHHAERETAMGFCLFANVSIAAKHALDRRGLSRVAIIDFDVHHGNGTQDALWDEQRVLFASSHQMPLYPGTGARTETGAHGNVLNVPLDEGTGGQVMRRVYQSEILPAVDAFAPELILISAGFDAHAADPLAGLMWQTEDFVWITQQICDLADTHCDGRLVSTLEGGYDLTALGQSVAAHVSVLMERGK